MCVCLLKYHYLSSSFLAPPCQICTQHSATLRTSKESVFYTDTQMSLIGYHMLWFQRWQSIVRKGLKIIQKQSPYLLEGQDLYRILIHHGYKSTKMLKSCWFKAWKKIFLVCKSVNITLKCIMRNIMLATSQMYYTLQWECPFTQSQKGWIWRHHMASSVQPSLLKAESVAQ